MESEENLMTKKRLTAAVICKDEIQVIERFLHNFIDCVDEMIIVDTGSTDGTLEFLINFVRTNKKYGQKMRIAKTKWNNNFAEARNTAFSLAAGDYVMWLDCDDIINDETRNFLRFFHHYADEHPDVTCFEMKYLLGRDAEGMETWSMNRERIVKNFMTYTWVGNIHEYLVVQSPNVQTKNMLVDQKYFIEHAKIKEHGSRNLDIFESMKKNNIAFTIRDKVYYGNELYDNGKFDEAYNYIVKLLKESKDQIWYGDQISLYTKLFYMKRNDDYDLAISWLFEAMRVSSVEPRADILYFIGEYKKSKGFLNDAIFWFKAAYNYDHGSRNDIFDKTYNKLNPALELMTIYWQLNDYETSKMWHLRSKEAAPNNPVVLGNEKWFKH